MTCGLLNAALLNGRDERGEQVANGIYFYRIKSAKGQSSHKTILIR